MILDVAFVPSEAKHWQDTVCIMVDVLRASSSIVTLFDRGCQSVVPVSSVAVARRLARQHGHILAGERNGVPPKNFQYGNSPVEFATHDFTGQSVVLTTSNGTVALGRLGDEPAVLIGCLLNATACCREAMALAGRYSGRVGIVCAGRQRKFVLDDGVCAGHLVDIIIQLAQEQGEELVLSEGANALRELLQGYSDIEEAFRASASGQRLMEIGHEDDIEFCARLDTTTIVPRLLPGNDDEQRVIGLGETRTPAPSQKSEVTKSQAKGTGRAGKSRKSAGARAAVPQIPQEDGGGHDNKQALTALMAPTVSTLQSVQPKIGQPGGCPVRLRVSPGAGPRTVHFHLEFAVPSADQAPLLAEARLSMGDGHLADLGLVCTPTTFSWREQRLLDLGEHRYNDPGIFKARVHWGEFLTQTMVDPTQPDSGELDFAMPDVSVFSVDGRESRTLQRLVRVQVEKLTRGMLLRLDAGVGQVYWICGDDGAEQAGECKVTYAKPGTYPVGLDLLDADGFWVATLAECQAEIAPPKEDSVLGRLPATERAVTPYVSAVDGRTGPPDDQPWLPFRYARPLWGWLRTYTSPGGGKVSRVLALGTYLSIRAEVASGSALWYETASGDWIPANVVEIVTPSALRGVKLTDEAPESRPEAPVAARRGVVTASVLSVRARPGVRADNPPVDYLHSGAEVQIFEEVTYAGAAWYRVGPDRWVHSALVQVVDGGPPVATVPTRRAVVLATLLGVRARPGAQAGNPPVDQLMAGTELTIYDEETEGGSLWYRIGTNRWVHSAHVRLIDGSGRSLYPWGGDHGIVTPTSLPAGWVVAPRLHVRARPGQSASNPPVEHVVHNQALPILETRNLEGTNWYRIGEDRWVEGSWIGVAREAARPSIIGASERWVAVNLREQTAVAYEGDRPVYAVLIASGAGSTPTVQGIYRTYHRVAWDKMSGGNPSWGSYYYLEDVTWTNYFYSGYSLHSAYWHDAFGRPRSHGCVNLSPHDAWWIYQWSADGGTNSPAVFVYPG